MTDQEKLMALLTDFGVDFSVENEQELTAIRCEAKSEKVQGYAGFYTDFMFNPDGSFAYMGAWE